MRNPICPPLGLTLLVIAALSGCSKKSADSEPAPETPVPAAATPPPATPAPVAAMPPTPTPVPKRLAPEGTFYLLVKKSVVTADGVTGFKPGTLVKREADGSFTAEGKKLEVQPSEITNDLDIAARYAGADALRQAAIRQSTSAMPPTPAASTASSSAPAASSNRPPAKAPAGGIVAPTKRTGSLDGSSALGAGHSMTKDGWLWQKDSSGNWRRVKPLR